MTVRTDYSDRREWRLEDYEVNYIHLDYRFGFDLSGFSGSKGYLKIVVGVPFRLRERDTEVTFEPDKVEGIGGALRILHRLAERVAVYRNGTLEVHFQGGLRLQVDRHDQYESWEAHGEGELEDIAFLCSPHAGPPWLE